MMLIGSNRDLCHLMEVEEIRLRWQHVSPPKSLKLKYYYSTEHSRHGSLSLSLFCISDFVDHQKLEREARICRLLKHPNIGIVCFS